MSIWIDRLIEDLAGSNVVVHRDESSSRLQIIQKDQESLDPAAHLNIDEEQFRQYLLRTASEAQEVFPLDPEMLAAYKVFLVHLDAALQMDVIPGSILTLETTRLNVDPRRQSDLFPPASTNDDPMEWRAN